MNLSIGLSNYQMVRDSFDISTWVKCTYNWKCNATACEDVGLNNGTFHSESDCQASCTADTSGSDNTSINEYDLNVSIYPNPFSDYTTLSLSSNVVRYQLIDLTGRLVYNKLVENQVEYLHKNQLKSGIYMLHLIREKGSNFERLLIELMYFSLDKKSRAILLGFFVSCIELKKLFASLEKKSFFCAQNGT